MDVRICWCGEHGWAHWYTGCSETIGWGHLVGISGEPPAKWSRAQGVVLLIHNTILALASAPLALVIGTETASVQLRQQVRTHLAE